MRNMSCVTFHEENKARINSGLPLALGLSLPGASAPSFTHAPHADLGRVLAGALTFVQCQPETLEDAFTESHSEVGTGLLALRQPSQRLTPWNHGSLASL